LRYNTSIGDRSSAVDPLANGLWSSMYWTYVLYNQLRNKIYIGQSQNLNIRLKRHNGELPNKISSYTHINNGKWEILYKEIYNTRLEAVTREKQLKTQKGREFIWNIVRKTMVTVVQR
jgi:putative endonuclease